MREPSDLSQYNETYLTDCEPFDWAEMERWMRLTPGQRIQTMIHAHQLAAGLVRGRLRRRHPDASNAEITWMLMEEWKRGG